MVQFLIYVPNDIIQPMISTYTYVYYETKIRREKGILSLNEVPFNFLINKCSFEIT